MRKENFDIAQIIASFLSGDISAEKQEILEKWLDESETNVLLFEKIISKDNRKRKQISYRKYINDAGWLKVQNDISRQKSRIIALKIIKYAAIFLIPIVIGGVLILRKDSPREISIVKSEIVSGGPKAKLILADGSVVNLEDNKGFEIEEKDGTNINKKESQLSYENVKEEKSQKLLYNTVETPRGGEYIVNLSDGTRVHLNAKSKLYFPVQFVGNKRVVELDGQGYFDVAKDKLHPFIVKTKNLNIRVLGTSFDISSYPDDENVTTTLVEGSVRIKAMGVDKLVVLEPNHQAVFNKVKRCVNVKEVDTRYYIAWKDGMFRFRDERLEDIMNILSRWYNVDVYFQNSDAKDLLFGCNVNKYNSIEPLLKIFENTEKVKMYVNKNSIIVKQVR